MIGVQRRSFEKKYFHAISGIAVKFKILYYNEKEPLYLLPNN